MRLESWACCRRRPSQGRGEQKGGPVTAVDESSKLVALKRARERLEAALALNESWQALRRPGAAGAGVAEAARLEAMLQTSPLYRAWKNVNAAIEARGSAEPLGPLPGAEQTTPAAAGDRHAARTLQAAERDRLDSAVATPPAAAHAFAPVRARPSPGDAERQQAKPTAAEASVSFIARAPVPAQGLPQVDASRPSAEQAGGSDGEANGLPLLAAATAEEAEVSVVSVDARRHADAVERLLRALHGDRDPG